MNSDSDLRDLAVRVGQHLRASTRSLVTAESCTGGWIGKVLTDVAGSSAWFAGGAVTYSNDLKQRVLDVDSRTLAEHGAVSEATAKSMAEGALLRLRGDLALAVTGIAGPDGGTAEKPVGLVWFAWARRRGNAIDTLTDRRVFAGDREAVRRATVAHALERILNL